ncbi:MAG: DUF998 domain-containing protein [Bacillota bacterium]
MTSRYASYQRIGAAAGIGAPLLAFTCILTAIASYPTFSWTDNALSDLGVIPGLTGFIFNFGLIISGLLSLVFAVLGLGIFLRMNTAGWVGSAVFASANLALTAIGIFNENFSSIHFLVSVAFFMLAPISLFILAYDFWFRQHRGMAIFTFLTGFIAALPWLLQFMFNYVPNVAVPEFLSGLAVSAWAIVLANKILRRSVTS